MLAAIAASVFIIGSASFVGQIRAAVQQAFPGHYRTIVGSVVLGAVLLGLVAAVRHVRERRAIRFALLTAALAIGALYAWLTRTGNPDVDAVERFHFVEYGVLALLFHRVWKGRDDVSAFLLPMLAGIVVGTLDELVQWFIPQRIGEIRDIALNSVAIACGVLFGAGLFLPRGVRGLHDPGSRRLVASLASATLVLTAVFFQVVHLGHEVSVAGSGTFRSRYASEELAAASRDRAARWAAVVPVQQGFMREDQYLSEGGWHIQERNRAWGVGDAWRAWHENRIIETFYGPVIAVALPAARWPGEQRADAAARAAATVAPFASEAHPFPIFAWSPVIFWTFAAAVIAAALAIGYIPRRRAAVHAVHAS